MADVPNNTNTSVSLAFGETYTGEIETANDEDWLSVELTAGVTYAFRMTGSTIGDGTLDDPFIKGLYDADGVSLNRFDDDGAGNRNSQLVFTPTESGTYYISAGSWETEVGTYKFTFAEYVAEAPTPYSSAIVDQVDNSGDDRIDGLLSGFRYQNVLGADTTEVTYSIPRAGSQWSTDPNNGYGPESGEGEPWDNIAYLTTNEAALFRDGLSQLESLAKLTLTEVADNSTSAGSVRVAWTGQMDEDQAAHAYYPAGSPVGGDIWILSENQGTGGEGSYFQLVLLHELGHAVGLKHPFDDDGSGVILPAEYDCLEYTLMAYNVSVLDEAIDGASFYPTSYMYLDILALQYMYGAAENATGNTTYTFASGQKYYETIWDTGGTDTYDASGQTRALTLDLTPGSWSNVGTQITLFSADGNQTKTDTVFTPPEVTVENAIGGSGGDRLIGNTAANRLTGNSGNDSLYGGNGNDTLSGGAGSDRIEAGKGNDLVTGGSSQSGIESGNDTVWAGDGNDSIYGAAGADRLGGGEGHDMIFGLGGNDTIFGGKGSSALSRDTLDGGAGDDEIYGGAGDDSVVGGAGNDLLYSGTGDDVIIGGAGDDTLWGMKDDDMLTGGDGADTFVFAAGHGDDVITDFDIGEDNLDLAAVNFNFTSVNDVVASATAATVSGSTGVLINLGGGDSVFLVGVSLTDIPAIDITL